MRNVLLMLLMLLVLPLLAVPAVSADDAGWYDRLAAARAEARESGRPLLVDLYAEWCGWCKVLEKEVFTHPDFQRRARDFVLLRVDVDDGGEGSRLQSRFGAFSLPTTLLLDAELAEVGRIEGFLPPADFLAAMEAEIDVHRRLLADYRRLLEGSDRRALVGLARELHRRRDGARAASVYERLATFGSKDSGEDIWLGIQRADALRLAGRTREAAETLARARERAAAAGDRELLEASDLLRVEIAREQGDCPEALAALKAFLRNYPDSRHQGSARQTLRDLDQACT